MNTVQKRVVWLIVAVLLVSGPVAHAAADFERQSLQGIEALEVAIEPLDEDDKQAGLTEASLRVLVESRLRKAGIKVVDNAAANVGYGFLYLNLGCLSIESGPELKVYMFCITLELRQGVKLARNSEFTSAVTWGSTRRGYCGVNKLAIMKEGVAELADEFINDFLAVNPK